MSVQSWEAARRVINDGQLCDMSYFDELGDGRYCGDIASEEIHGLRVCATCAEFLRSIQRKKV